MELFSWKFKEELVRKWLIEAYSNKGYDCINLHKSGASVEDGIDVFSRNDNHEIAVAVKIKPQTKDIAQLNRLMKDKAKEKVYVYIDDPTKPFLDEIRKNNNLKLLGKKELHQFLIENKSLSYVKNHLFSHDLFKELASMLKIWASVRGVNTSKVTPEDMRELWNLKDKAVIVSDISF